MRIRPTRLQRTARTVRAAAWLLSSVAGACSVGGLLDVDVVDRVDVSEFERPENAVLLIRSAVADFDCAFSHYVLAAGLIADELADGGGDASMWHYDRRSIQPSDDGPYATTTCADPRPGIYTTLSVARFQSDNARRILTGFSDAQVADRQGLLATAAAYAGYGYLLLGEAMCSAAVDGGPELSSAELLGNAEARFGEAMQLAAASSNPAITNLARVGRARARLDLGNGAGALQDAAGVPEGFVHLARYSSASLRSSNRVWTFLNRDARAVVADVFRDVRYQGTADPRISVRNAGTRRQDAFDLLWVQLKYPNQDSPIPIARTTEALLIAAEVQGGQAAVNIINQLHTRHGLPPFSSTDPNQILSQLVYERRAELFLESHRYFDLRRLGIPAIPVAGDPFPYKGGSYGPLTCLPLPNVERNNNPNI